MRYQLRQLSSGHRILGSTRKSGLVCGVEVADTQSNDVEMREDCIRRYGYSVVQMRYSNGEGGSTSIADMCARAMLRSMFADMSTQTLLPRSIMRAMLIMLNIFRTV